MREERASGVAIIESSGTTMVSEGGEGDTCTAVLTFQPIDGVTITVSPDDQIDLGSGAGIAVTLFFTAADWNFPQTISISAVDDSIVEGPHTATLRFSVSSGDRRFNGYAIAAVTVNIIDNDPASGTACSDADVNNDIPFNYTLETDHLAIHTPGGVLKTHIGPWGAHTQPHTGHEDGDAKANWSGFFATRYDELTELEGDGDGTCERGEVCGMAAVEIDARIPEYIAPDDNLKIRSVRVAGVVTAGDTYRSVLQWDVDASICRFGYLFGHVGKISRDLRDKMITAGYADPWTVTGISDNLITGEPITLSKGESIGFPQILAQEVSGHPGYYKGGGSFLQTPWAQIEFSNLRSVNENEPFYFNDFYPLYGWLRMTTQDALRNILYADATNPASFRYEHEGLIDWLWKAEMDLWTVNGFIYDFSNIFSRLGGWWENEPAGCVPGTALCDEVFSIFPIIKRSPFYDAALYDSTGVSYLVHHWQADIDRGPGFKRHYEWGEVIQPETPAAVSGSIIIKWRIDHTTISPVYQAVSYQVFPDAEQLKIRWGSRESDRAVVSTPPIPAEADICDGVQLTCHSNGSWPW